MLACYDLAFCPPTYDVVAFLALLEEERRRVAAPELELHILPGPAHGFRADGLWPLTPAERIQLLNNVLVPLCSLLPAVQQVVVRRDRAVEGWGKSQYLISLPAILTALRAGMRPLRARNILPEHSRTVTFTLREAAHYPPRNSRTSEWLRAAKILMAQGVRVVVVRDTLRAAEPLDGVETSAEAARDLLQRAALYASSRLNVGICNGPIWMAIFMDAPVLMLRPTTNSIHGCYNDAFYARCGLPRGAQLPTSPPHQRLVWEEDGCDNIVRAVEEMLTVVS